MDGLETTRALLFYALVAAFAAPALLYIDAWARPRGLPWSARVALAVTAALGVFSALSGIPLLEHYSADLARRIALVGWAAAALGAATLWLGRLRRRPAQGGENPSESAASAALDFRVPVGRFRWVVSGTTALVLALGAARGWGPRAIWLVALGALSMWIGTVVRRRAESDAAPENGGSLARIARVAAGLGIAFMLISSVLYVREDFDDAQYLAAAVALPGSDAMYAGAPGHPDDGFAPNPLYSWQSFELWAALCADAVGVPVAVAMRTLLAPLLIALALALLHAWLVRLLPARWVWVGMALSIAYLSYAMTSQWTANNFLLPRPAQGKTWLVHVALPALALVFDEYQRRPSLGTVGLALALSFAALGFAPISVYLVPLFAGALFIAALFDDPTVAAAARLAPLSIALLPPLGFGIWLLSAMSTVPLEIIDWGNGGHWRDLIFFVHLGFNDGGGALELFVLALSPWLLLALPRGPRRAYPVVFVWVYLATALNPSAHPFLAEHVTGGSGYHRLMWALPFGLLFALLGTLGVALAERARQGGGIIAFALALALPALVGGHFVWGSANHYFERLPPPARAENAYKMPAGLLEVARHLAQEPSGPRARILASERAAVHLAVFDPRLELVYLRHYQTTLLLAAAGRGAESEVRERLVRGMEQDSLDASEQAELLRAAHARYVVVDAPGSRFAARLPSLGYTKQMEAGSYALFAR